MSGFNTEWKTDARSHALM